VLTSYRKGKGKEKEREGSSIHAVGRRQQKEESCETQEEINLLSKGRRKLSPDGERPPIYKSKTKAC